jgi:hypothetical protein
MSRPPDLAEMSSFWLNRYDRLGWVVVVKPMDSPMGPLPRGFCAMTLGFVFGFKRAELVYLRARRLHLDGAERTCWVFAIRCDRWDRKLASNRRANLRQAVQP